MHNYCSDNNTSLLNTRCKLLFTSFIKESLKLIKSQNIERGLPAIPHFRPVLDERKRNIKYKKVDQPNWWQISKSFYVSAFSTNTAQELINLLNTLYPFNYCIGKTIHVVELGTGHGFKSAIDIIKFVLISYLFSTTQIKWDINIFNRIWNECLQFYDQKYNSLQLMLYAPIYIMPPFNKKIAFENNLNIIKLSPKKIAAIASKSAALRGVSILPGYNIWTDSFFVKPINGQKIIIDIDAMISRNSESYFSLFNNETTFLRSFLHESIAVTTFEIFYEGLLQIQQGNAINTMPWKPKYPAWFEPPNYLALKKYLTWRSKFLSYKQDGDWERVFSSMRRYAAAWDNSFRSDILADLVAALENLVVGDKEEVGYKLRMRVSHFISKSKNELLEINQNIKTAYEYRSRIFHGRYIFDNPNEWQTASLLGTKRQQGNLFFETNEVDRLIPIISNYYRTVLSILIDKGQINMGWSKLGL